jgi:hypothetical protein
MGSPPNILECRKDYIKPLFFQELYETRLIAINDDRIRIDAKCIHVDAVSLPMLWDR